MTDPYKVLGVSQSASNDEVKKAYRELSRKYHPDSYADNPLADLAEEKFKEIQDAYHQIIDEREKGYSSASYAQGSQGQASYQQYYDEDTTQMRQIYSMLMMNQFREALNELARVDQRGAKWNYYNGVAYAGLGNIITAMSYAKRAVSMEPQNQQYTQFLFQLQNSSRNYHNAGGGTSSGNSDACDMCCKLWIADSLCECMGGDLCPCM